MDKVDGSGNLVRLDSVESQAIGENNSLCSRIQDFIIKIFTYLRQLICGCYPEAPATPLPVDQGKKSAVETPPSTAPAPAPAPAAVTVELPVVVEPPKPKLPELYKHREPGLLKENEAREHMEKNFGKAITEHQPAGKDLGYCKLGDLAPVEKPISLTFDKRVKTDIGPKLGMEDEHMYVETDNYILTGVFDGHGYQMDGKKNPVAEKLAKSMGDVFAGFIKEHHVHAALELTFAKIDEEIQNQRIGSTAVVCYIDKRTNLIYTATTADSEANIYRKFDGVMKSVPLSVVRNLSHPKEALRAVHHWGWAGEDDKLEAYEAFIRTPPERSKHLRVGVSVINSGPNMSRCFGDKKFKALICKPKITVCQLQEGDIVTLVSDGVKDFATERELIGALSSDLDHPAWALANCARSKMDKSFWSLEENGGDNITAIAIKVNRAEGMKESKDSKDAKDAKS